MKKIIFLSLFCTSILAFSADNAPIIRMAVFPDNTVFTMRKGVIPANAEGISFFEDKQFFKGSFSLWSKDVAFAVKQMPKKRFNANIYANLNNAFANQNVVVTLKRFGSREHTVSGKLIKIENPENPYEIPSVIAVQDNVSKQTTYIKVHDIETIRADKADFMNDIHPAPCWIFSRKNIKKALPFEFSYLADGIVWQSVIELHLNSKNKMDIIHNAIIRNNGEKFVCPEFYLVSGSPEIATKNITSLLCQNILPQRKNYAPLRTKTVYGTRNDMAMAMASPAAAGSFISQSSDVFYRALGKIAMDKNESRQIKLQSAAAVPYRTVVKWDIPARRNTYGRIIGSNDQQTADNTLIFKNLCPAMLDSAPIAIYADKKLMMLTNLDSNTPVNAERSIRLSSADGIECQIEENELVKQRIQNVIFNNRRYVKCTIEATLKITNYRKIPAPAVINYNFSGEFVKSENADGRLISKADGSSLLNPNSSLKFEFDLKPAESKTVKVTYTVLTNM